MTSDELNLQVATKVLGWIPWLKVVGSTTLYYVIAWQKPGEQEPWMGSRDWKVLKERYTPFDINDYDPAIHTLSGGFPDFQGDISDAWQVIKSLHDKEWFVSIHIADTVFVDLSKTGETFEVDEQEAPIAICLAALKAVGGEDV